MDLAQVPGSSPVLEPPMQVLISVNLFLTKMGILKNYQHLMTPGPWPQARLLRLSGGDTLTCCVERTEHSFSLSRPALSVSELSAETCDLSP